MKDTKETIKDGLLCNAILELYIFFCRLERPYIRVMCEKDDTEYLYRIKNVDLKIGEKQYRSFGYDDIADLPIPYCKWECVELDLERMLANEPVSRKLDVGVDSLYQSDLTRDEILKEYDITIPSDNELDMTTFIDDLPVSYIEKKPEHLHKPSNIWDYSSKCMIQSFKEFLDDDKFSYIYDSLKGTSRFTMQFEGPQCPEGLVESNILFHDNHTEIRMFYAESAASIREDSERRLEVLELLNYINSSVFIKQPGHDYYRGTHEPQIFFVPRFYIDEDQYFNINAVTMINYLIWKSEWAPLSYITEYLPEMLNKLAPFIFGVINGEMVASEAIDRIKEELICKGE